MVNVLTHILILPHPGTETVKVRQRELQPRRGRQSMLEAVWSTMVWREGTIHSITRSLMMLSGG